jgi:acyl-coenzyme A synthetase/AMP-(fatty) acid ligase
MLGYWNESTPNPSYPKSHSLGDIVEQHKQNIWVFLSRSTDIIKARGIRISPVKIEAILVQNQNILESIVFQKHGIIEVALALKTMQDMSEYLLVIPHWIRPKKLHYFHKILPRSPRGKKSRQWIVNNVLYPKTSAGNH